MPDYVIDQERPWLGGFLAGGDPATVYPELWDWLVGTLRVITVWDVGCGEGWALKHFRERGCVAHGVDGLEQDDPDICVHDYTTGQFMPPEYDLAWCCEFVEHVEEQYVPNFLATFRNARYVVMTHGTPGQPGHHHVNCVVEGTKVASPDVEAAFRRRYVGDVITLVTADGDKLTVTPNHPIATPAGWTAAGLLQQGDDLVSGSGADWIPRRVMPNADQAPVVVEQVFGSLEKVNPSGIRSVPTSAQEFHGDGSDGDVDVVRANGLLCSSSDAALTEEQFQQQLRWRRVRPSILARFRPLRLGGFRVMGTTSRREHDGCSFGPLLAVQDGPGLLHALRQGGGRQPSLLQYAGHGSSANRGQVAHGLNALSLLPRLQYDAIVNVLSKTFRSRADVDASLGQMASGGAEVSVGLGRELGERFPRQVAVTKLANTHRSQYIGHVYNLSTADECYWANGLIVHNCQTPSYWKGALAAIGFHFERELTSEARRIAALNQHHSNHFVRSGLVFCSGTSFCDT